MMRIKGFASLALAGALAAGSAAAGDWREVKRHQGLALGIDVASLMRTGDALEADMVVAILPDRHLPLYSIFRLQLDCSSLSVVMGGAQYYLANGDPFGERQPDAESETFEQDGLLTDLCDGVMPTEIGADSANAFFHAAQTQDE